LVEEDKDDEHPPQIGDILDSEGNIVEEGQHRKIRSISQKHKDQANIIAAKHKKGALSKDQTPNLSLVAPAHGRDNKSE
jgi:hypothetical protein